MEPVAARKVRDREKQKEKRQEKKKSSISKKKQAELYGKAEESYKKAIELDPRNDGAIFALAELYRKQGRKAEAKEKYERALDFNPGNSSYFEGLLLLYPESTLFRDYSEYQVSEEWVETYRKLLKSAVPPFEILVRIKLYKVLLKFNRKKEAELEFEKLPDEHQWRLLHDDGDLEASDTGLLSR